MTRQPPKAIPSQSGEVDKLREQIETLLDNDPVCNGRVSCATVEAIVALQSLPHTDVTAEELSRAIDPGAWDDNLPIPSRAQVELFHTRRQAANEAAFRVLAVLGPTNKDAQEAIERRFKLGERVEKIKGSSWRGRVVGFYSTKLTPEGYAIESENEPGSVQIYPVSAIRSLAK